MSLSGATDFDKLKELCTLTHKEQVIWFLNSFWHKHADEAELLWKYQHKFAELDLQNHEAGHDLDELNAHRFLEFFNETMTVRQMRDTLRATGAIGDKFKNVPITHYLIYRYSADWKYLVNASQGDNQAEIEQAQRMLEAVQAAYKESEAKAQAAAAALREAQAREAEAKAREAAAVAAVAEAKLREEESHAAKAELEVALAEVQKQEDAYNNKKADLERKSEEGGVVSRNKAKAELAQHLAEDPLPLRRAKINQEAAVKKAERATIAAAAAVEASVVARANAEEATRQSEAATRQSAAAKAAAEEAVREAEARVAEAEAFLNEVKKKPGQAQGAIWWIEREIQETRNYLPESKGGVRRK